MRGSRREPVCAGIFGEDGGMVGEVLTVPSESGMNAEPPSPKPASSGEELSFVDGGGEGQMRKSKSYERFPALKRPRTTAS